MGAIRKGRFAAISLSGLAVVALMGAGIARGDLPMNAVISGVPFDVSVDGIEGTGVIAYPHTVSTKTGDKPSLALKVNSATIRGLCLGLPGIDIPAIGSVALLIRSPKMTASGLVLEADTISGRILLNNVAIGIDTGSAGVGDAGSSVSVPGIAVGGLNTGSERIHLTSMRASSIDLGGANISVARNARC